MNGEGLAITDAHIYPSESELSDYLMSTEVKAKRGESSDGPRLTGPRAHVALVEVDGDACHQT